MKLQRENFYGSDVAGDWYSADDVDALLASIREAVAAEREAVRSVRGDPRPEGYMWLRRAALDALLSIVRVVSGALEAIMRGALAVLGVKP